MLINFEIAGAKAQVLATNPESIAGGWRHFQVSGTAGSEVFARTLAEEIKQLFTYGRETRWRVAFEYKPLTRYGSSLDVQEWHLYARFSVKRQAAALQNIVASDPSPPNIDPSPEPLDASFLA